MMFECILIDDEPQAIDALVDELKPFNHLLNIIATAGSVKDAVALIDSLQPNLVFLDIRLKDGSGFEVLQQIIHKNCHCVFVTAYDSYAIQAFKVNAIDYLLKPVHANDIKQCIQKLAAITPALPKMYAQLVHSLTKESAKQRVSFSTSEGISVFYVDEIIRCQADNNYSIIYTTKEKLYTSKTLKDLEEQLHAYGFERTHQSHLINIACIKKYLHKEGGYVVLEDGTELPVSRRKKIELLEKLTTAGYRY